MYAAKIGTSAYVDVMRMEIAYPPIIRAKHFKLFVYGTGYITIAMSNAHFRFGNREKGTSLGQLRCGPAGQAINLTRAGVVCPD